MEITELCLNGIPYGIEILTKYWEGESSMAKITFSVSFAAFNNNNFDALGFISKMFFKSIDAIRCKKGIDTLHLFPSFRMNNRVARNCIVYNFYIEYAKI